MRFTTIAAAVFSIFAASAVSAATTGTYEGTFDGNDPCPSLDGGKTDISSVIGTDFCIAKFDVEGGSFTAGEAGDGVDSGILGQFSLTGAGSSSGTWLFNPGAFGLVLTHVVLKAGPEFSVFELAGETMGDWMTSPYLQGRDLSHISFYGREGDTPVIPLPASLPLVLGAFGMLALTRRKRS